MSEGSSLAPGDIIDSRYRVIRAIDQGGMGSVFLAEHVMIKRRVAVKLLRAELAEQTDALDRFMNEARAAGTLGHPNIVESTDMGFTRDGLPYIVFEYLEGTLLTDEIYRVSGFATRRALRIARQIASALGAAHAANIIHRDLKADNVFLIDRDDAPDHVKVLDFGVSRFLDGEADTGKNLVVGTPQFMAPEQIEAPDSVDRRTDIYALGVILYEMLTARRPFVNDSDPDDLFRQILTQPPPPLGVPVPRGFEEMLVAKFLAKRPADRFQSMKEVEAELETFANMVRTTFDSIPIARIDMPLPGDLPQAAAVVSLPPPPRRARTAWLVAAIACAGAASALLVVGAREPELVPLDTAPLHADADKVGAAIDAASRAAELRADGFAQSPQLRAAVETDAATVKDMLKGDFILKQAKGEIFELFQRRGGASAPLYMVPEGAPLALPAPGQPQLRSDGKALAVVVSAPIGEAGGIALATGVDLAPIAAQLAAHASGVMLEGIAPPLALVPVGSQPGERVELVVPIRKELGASLKLVGTVQRMRAEPDRRLARARLGSWVAAGFFALLYLGSLIRTRRRG